MSIVETMARAICLDVDVLAQGGPDSRYGSITERVEASWRDYTATARAALRAIKPEDVSDGMLDIFEERFRFHINMNAPTSRDDLRRAAAAMLNAAGAEQ